MSHLGTTTRMSMATATTTTLLSSPFPQRLLPSPAAYRKFSKRQFSTDRLRNSSTVKSSPADSLVPQLHY
uniref:Uncharacterized protein n=1 Tax=Kalanchoe fedtschenkoi TaxID=63787 RepID=A0A7N0ZZ68_KALFE